VAQVKVKTITYKPNGDKPEENNSGFDPFYGSEGENLIEFPRDRIKPWYEDTKRKDYNGVLNRLTQMSDKEYREFMGGYLVPYGYKEEDIMKMPLKELEYLFEGVMRI
jgi:hypothetical protein